MHHVWETLGDSVYRCRLAFCDVTIGLVCGPGATLLVDTGTTLAEARSVQADIRRLAARPVTHVVLTHKHFDHVLGSAVFNGAEIYCAPEVVEYLASAPDQLRAEALGYGADAGAIDEAIAALRVPQRGTLREKVDLGDRTVTIAHLGAGHTRSDLVVVVPAREPGEQTVVFTGDLVEESADPAIDADSDVAAWPETLDRLLAIGGPDAVFVPGMGGWSTPRSSTANGIGCDRRPRERGSMRGRDTRGDERVRFGDAEHQYLQGDRLPPDTRRYRRIHRQLHQTLARAVDQPAGAHDMHSGGENPLVARLGGLDRRQGNVGGEGPSHLDVKVAVLDPQFGVLGSEPDCHRQRPIPPVKAQFRLHRRDGTPGRPSRREF